jgi:hypothetical protein
MMGNSSSQDQSSPSKRWLGVATFVVILAAAAAVRVRGAQNDLWDDEIRALQRIERISSPAQVFTAIHVDANHYLSSLWMYSVGPHGNPLEYRTASIVLGVGTVGLAWLIGRRRDPAAAWIAMLLTGSSYFMVLYSSEARGYSGAVFFAFLAYYLLESYLAQPNWKLGVLFSLSVILGFLSQLVFGIFFLAAIVWSGYRIVNDRWKPRHIAAAALCCCALPTAAMAALWWVDIRHLVVLGGGPNDLLVPWYRDSLAWAIGPLSQDWGMTPACLACLAILMAGIWLLWREKSDSFVFFIAVVVVVPLLLAAFRRPDVRSILPRYMIVGIAFLLVLFAFLLSSLYRRRAWGKAICALLLAAFFTANGQYTLRLFKYGRGDNTETVRFMVEHTAGPAVRIATENESCISSVLAYYGQRLQGSKKMKFCPFSAWRDVQPEWTVSWCPLVSQADQVDDKVGKRYETVMIQESAPLSGYRWHISHNQQKYGPVRPRQ